MGLEIKPYKIYLLGILFLGNMISKDTVCQRFLFFVYRENKRFSGGLSHLSGAAVHLAQGFFFFSSTTLLLPTHLPPPLCRHAQSCNPMDCSPPGSSVHGLFPARILEWVAISSRHRAFIRTWASPLPATFREVTTYLSGTAGSKRFTSIIPQAAHKKYLIIIMR